MNFSIFVSRGSDAIYDRARKLLDNCPTVSLDDDDGTEDCWNSLYEHLYSDAAAVRLSDDGTVDDLLDAMIGLRLLPESYLKRGRGLRRDDSFDFYEYVLVRNATTGELIFDGSDGNRGRLLDQRRPGHSASSRALRKLGVADGDDIEVTVTRQYQYETVVPLNAMPQRSLRDLRMHLAAWEESAEQVTLPEAPYWGDSLSGVLLYTEEDKEVAAYVRRHYLAIHDLSGPHLTIHVFERPVGPAGVRYWRHILGERFFRLCCSLGWVSSIPFDLRNAYAAADYLGVDRSHLPCLVIFDTVDRPNKLVISMTPLSAQRIRIILSKIDGILRQKFDSIRHGPGNTVREYQKVAFDAVGSAHESILHEAFRRAPLHDGAYNFFGQTVFISKPKNTIIRDFQNRNSSG
ncbi:hypothetical protein [Dactylosporangium sp. NPDC048998]|uniref:hypothetical protein n=1 Tax=Dactylosporangium sp. NPDC048998 TaxID=3363976 RepID=UPI003724AA26